MPRNKLRSKAETTEIGNFEKRKTKNNKKQLKRRQTRFAKGFQSLCRFCPKILRHDQRLYKTDGTAPPARPMSPSSKSTRRSKAKDVTNVFQRFHSMVSGPSKQSCQGMGKNVVHEKCRYNRFIHIHIFLSVFIFWLYNWFMYVIEIYLFIHLCVYLSTSLFCVYFWMIKYILKKKVERKLAKCKAHRRETESQRILFTRRFDVQGFMTKTVWHISCTLSVSRMVSPLASLCQSRQLNRSTYGPFGTRRALAWHGPWCLLPRKNKHRKTAWGRSRFEDFSLSWQLTTEKAWKDIQSKNKLIHF